MDQTWKVWLVDTGERVLTTMVEVAIVYVLAAQAIDGAFWRGLVVALVTGVVNVIKAALTYKIPKPRSWALDMMVRALWTFVISLLGALASAGWLDIISMEYWKMIALAGATSVLSMLKSLIAKQRANTITPASLAPASAAA
jgi:hypothetical protein